MLYMIHQCVDAAHFEMVGDCTTSKKTWEILEKSYAVVADKAKVMSSQEATRVNSYGRKGNY